MKDIFTEKTAQAMLMYETEPFDDDNYIYELKLDGIRALLYIDGKQISIRNKRNKDITAIYPELREIYRCVDRKVILDGELVVFTEGKPDFFALQRRSLMTSPFKISIASIQKTVEFVVYDILYADKQVTHLPLLERKKLLENNVAEGRGLSLVKYIEGKGIDFFNLIKENGLEGIVAKRKSGVYRMGKRCREWLKIKVMRQRSTDLPKNRARE